MDGTWTGFRRGGTCRSVGLLLLSVILVSLGHAQTVDRGEDALFNWRNLPGPPVNEGEIDQRLAALEKARDTGDFEGIMRELEALHRKHPDNGEILWRLARTRTDVGERREDKDERRELYVQALEEAERAVELLPEHSNAHLTKAVAAGRAALVSGTRQKVDLSRTVREYADKAIARDSTNDLAYHVRGRWHHEVASLGFFSRNIVRLVYGGLPDASLQQAEADFRQAIELEDRVVHRYELGRVLLERGKKAEARTHLQKAIEMPYGDVTDPKYKKKARALLARM